jgi:hypothetical protein
LNWCLATNKRIGQIGPNYRRELLNNNKQKYKIKITTPLIIKVADFHQICITVKLTIIYLRGKINIDLINLPLPKNMLNPLDIQIIKINLKTISTNIYTSQLKQQHSKIVFLMISIHLQGLVGKNLEHLLLIWSLSIKAILNQLDLWDVFSHQVVM